MSEAPCSTWWTVRATASRSRRGCLPRTSWIQDMSGTSTNYVVVILALHLEMLLEGGVLSWFHLSPEGGRDPPRDIHDTQVCPIHSL